MGAQKPGQKRVHWWTSSGGGLGFGKPQLLKRFSLLSTRPRRLMRLNEHRKAREEDDGMLNACLSPAPE
eukprot:CAMPEP_0174711444 /NCGR_PEP_ID=MMETSP1094-20130205/12766_1 /TAXON_ID=156173 /ORGANISM="Chrysochromulina brevifilum, Strain UTEX LB 985" /LENGTH=68 /DNA_ID=CAMNT_0015910385 /DNA_START=276 /DNA_END=482 /DNA_ORIENTATION=+